MKNLIGYLPSYECLSKKTRGYIIVENTRPF